MLPPVIGLQSVALALIIGKRLRAALFLVIGPELPDASDSSPSGGGDSLLLAPDEVDGAPSAEAPEPCR